eukprot:TRINITY_DN7019_c0_g1_i2.p1 TRINITY_DN7019_c0_g1~~TRINITY_DN7019_c0_g1_i2.p1  ORF type:complete len:413 (+),score=21.32 TRINITY_DN7019_c0_g1_i2:46-1284(+)
MAKFWTSFVLLCFLIFVECKYKLSVVDEFSDFSYVSKFCFNLQYYEMGSLIGVALPLIDNQNFFFYNESQWPIVFKNPSMSCQEKQARSVIPPFNFTKSMVEVGFEADVLGTDGKPYFLYVVASNCNQREAVEYELWFRNAPGLFTSEFSCEDQGLLETYLVFFPLYFLMWFIQLRGRKELLRMGEIHPIVNLLTSAMALKSMCVLSLFIHLFAYGFNGTGALFLDWIGQLAGVGGELCCLFLILVIARGWTISTTLLGDRRPLYVIGFPFIIAYLFFFIWKAADIHPESVNTIWETPPGITVLVLRVLFCGIMLFFLQATYRAENDNTKRTFYVRIGCLATLWLLLFPTSVLIVSNFHPWVRTKVMTVISLVLDGLLLSSLTFVLWPTRVGQVFAVVTAPSPAANLPYQEL